MCCVVESGDRTCCAALHSEAPIRKGEGVGDGVGRSPEKNGEKGSF